MISALTPDFSTPSLPSVSSVSILSETPPPPSPASAVSAFLLRPPTPPKRADVILERSLINNYHWVRYALLQTPLFHSDLTVEKCEECWQKVHDLCKVKSKMCPTHQGVLLVCNPAPVIWRNNCGDMENKFSVIISLLACASCTQVS